MPFREAGTPSNTMWPGPIKAHLHAKCHLDPSGRLATIDMGRKLGRGLLSLFVEVVAGFPSNTMSSGPRPTSVPSGILIHAAVWPQ